MSTGLIFHQRLTHHYQTLAMHSAPTNIPFHFLFLLSGLTDAAVINICPMGHTDSAALGLSDYHLACKKQLLKASC